VAAAGLTTTCDEAIGHAARILAEAELERCNLPLMERLERIADSWINIANLLREKERV